MLDQLKAKITAENGILKLENIAQNTLCRFLEGNWWDLEKAYAGLVAGEQTMIDLHPWEMTGSEEYQHILDMKLMCFLGVDKVGHQVEYLDASAYKPELISNDYSKFVKYVF